MHTQIDLEKIYPTLANEINLLVTHDYSFVNLTSSHKDVLIAAFIQDADYAYLYDITESINLRRGLLDLFHNGINYDLMKYEVKEQISKKFQAVFKDLFFICEERYQETLAESLAEDYL